MSETSEATPLSPAGSKPQVIVVKDTLELAERTAAHVATLAREAIRARGSFHVALGAGVVRRRARGALRPRRLQLPHGQGVAARAHAHPLGQRAPDGGRRGR